MTSEVKLDPENPDIAYALRMLTAVRHIISTAGALPCRSLIAAAAREHALNSDELAARVLEVVLAAEGARRWLNEHAQQVA